MSGVWMLAGPVLRDVLFAVVALLGVVGLGAGVAVSFRD